MQLCLYLMGKWLISRIYWLLHISEGNKKLPVDKTSQVTIHVSRLKITNISGTVSIPIIRTETKPMGVLVGGAVSLFLQVLSPDWFIVILLHIDHLGDCNWNPHLCWSFWSGAWSHWHSLLSSTKNLIFGILNHQYFAFKTIMSLLQSTFQIVYC